MQRRNIEILKIRFGEAALQVCEVMLKDMTDSKRIDTHIQGQKPVCLLFCDKCDLLLTVFSPLSIQPSFQDISGQLWKVVRWLCQGNFRSAFSVSAIIKRSLNV